MTWACVADRLLGMTGIRPSAGRASGAISCEHPLCAFCAERGLIVPATICDHVEPHHGDINKFWLERLQSLCKPCHDGAKKVVEQRGYRTDIGLDGWPTDPRHPVYRTR